MLAPTQRGRLPKGRDFDRLGRSKTPVRISAQGFYFLPAIADLGSTLNTLDIQTSGLLYRELQVIGNIGQGPAFALAQLDMAQDSTQTSEKIVSR